MSITALLPVFGKVLDRILPDKAKQMEARLKLMELEQAGELKELDAAISIITAEANSSHWIVAAWRPITMLVFTAIIFNNYLIYPYLSLFWTSAPVLDLPPDLWGLLKIGLGGYVVGRSAEKVAEVMKK